MLSLESLKNFYFLPDLHDMRCGAQRVLETIKIMYGRYPYSGDVFVFMSKNRRWLKMVQYENNAFYIHEKVLSVPSSRHAVLEKSRSWLGSASFSRPQSRDVRITRTCCWESSRSTNVC